MKRLILTLAFTGMIFAIAGCSSGTGTNNATGESGNFGNTAVKATITKYFNGCFDAQKTLAYSRMNTILADNDNINMNEKFRETDVAAMQAFNDPISRYQYKLEYKNVTATDSTASVDLVLNLDYHYKNAPSNLNSGIYGVNYHFEMKNSGSGWIISEINSDQDRYVKFKEEVQQQMAQNAALKQADAVERVGKEKLSRLQMIRQNTLYLRGSAAAGGDVTANSANLSDSNITKSVYQAYGNYSYSPTNAIAYAERFAKAPIRSRLFYTAYINNHEVDCTNFISQCIWAGYGGFVPTSETATENNIHKKSHMDPGNWFAGTGGGATNWENVASLWSYLTGSSAVGPHGVGYNNGGIYTNVGFSSINEGDVLQFRQGYSGSYEHSVIVTGKANIVSEYDDIYVSYHTTNSWNVALSGVISGFGDSICCMRRIALSTPRPLYNP